MNMVVENESVYSFLTSSLNVTTLEDSFDFI